MKATTGTKAIDDFMRNMKVYRNAEKFQQWTICSYLKIKYWQIVYNREWEVIQVFREM